MAYTDTYRECIERIPDLIHEVKSKNKSPMFGFTSNLDVILKWDEKKYNAILKEFLDCTEPKADVGDLVYKMQDFARITAAYMARGLGGSFFIMDLAVCEYLRSHFDTEFYLGGTCAQGAAAFGRIGFPVNIHISDRCKEVCDLLSEDGITSVKDGRKVPVAEICSGEPPIYHFILQFNRGDIIRIGDKEVVIPESNRLIFCYDQMQKDFPIDDGFFSYWENGKECPTSVSISGFDAILDADIMDRHTDRIAPLLRKIKERSPKTVIYFEGAFYMNAEMKDRILDTLGQYTDIIGMNEEELKALLERKKLSVDLDSADEIMKALEMLLKLYRTKGIVLHTKDYSLYYGDDCNGYDIKSGLTMGNILSTTRARISHYGNLEECRETLGLELSKRGLALADAIERIETKRRVEIVPSRYLSHPACTIGLGDTFVAGVQTCFLTGGE
jgi:ADP-dependent phosphofructokinase/glucokinase